MIMKMAQGVKDSALALLIKKFVNDRLPQYGQVVDCAIDTGNGRVRLRCLLKGENETIDAAIERYEIVREEDGSYIRLKEFSSSREWLTVLLQRYLVDKQYKLPSAISSLL